MALRDILAMIFGGRNAVKETVEIFRANAEASAVRDHEYNTAALAQLAAEFGRDPRGRFDRFVDGLNRLPRPMLALGTILLMIAAMTDPVWFAERMQGIALVPEPLWWLLGIIVAFYFGARHQAKGQEFQRSITQAVSRVPHVVDTISSLRGLDHQSPGVADAEGDAEISLQATAAGVEANPALDEWQQSPP